MNMNERTIQNGVCRVQMTGICKSFGGINALNDVSLGASCRRDPRADGRKRRGQVDIDAYYERRLSGGRRRNYDRRRKKSRCFHRRTELTTAFPSSGRKFSLMPHLTVAENILIDELNTGKKNRKLERIYRKARAILDELGYSNIDERSAVGSLSTSAAAGRRDLQGAEPEIKNSGSGRADGAAGLAGG